MFHSIQIDVGGIAVTPEKIMELTRKYIRLENMTLIVVGDKAKIESQLQETVELPLKQ